jgi:predicted DNA-binding transcriptional regulator AlpA
MSAAIDLTKLVYFDTQEIIALLKISQATLWRYRDQDINPFPKAIWLGKNVYLETEVMTWLLANRR